MTLALGLDFGTEAVRAFVLDVADGRERASRAERYHHGVIDSALPTGEPLPQGWALQDPADWLDAMARATRGAILDGDVDGGDVVGLGVAFTSCTVLPTDACGTPLCQLESFGGEPHAWPKLWKHHAAQPCADAVNALASERGEEWLASYGGRVSAEWLIPKAMEIAAEAPAIDAAAAAIVEAGDWIVWQLTGALVRNACAAGFKALWRRGTGYPAPEFLAALQPKLEDLFTSGRAGGRVVAPGTPMGTLRPRWAAKLGLPHTVVVGAAVVDAHAGLVGAGAVERGTLYLATGTSTCHLLVAAEHRPVPGICGVVEDGIVPGAVAYEAGQASVGDTFDWYVRVTGRGHEELTSAAERLAPAEHGLLALDWWSGCRTPLADANLTGALLGLTPATPVEAVYRALLEATAFGTRLVVETFLEAGVSIDRLVVGGGLTGNTLLLRLYADVTGLPVTVTSCDQPSARGAAIFGAAAAGARDVAAGATLLEPPPRALLEADAQSHALYIEQYDIYRSLVAQCGAADSPLKRLSTLRRRSEARTAVSSGSTLARS